MKYIISWVAFLCAALIILPVSMNLFSSKKNIKPEQSVSVKNISVYFTDTGKVKTMDINEYIVGVVSAEMPASFESEALKAQAVAARTYTLSKLKQGSSSAEHKGADVCTDFAHCQAYIPQEKAVENWGKNASEYLKKCKNAVCDTANIIMVYDNEPVRAVFHSSSSGKTENAKDVWGGNVPYLVSVESPGEEKCPSHESVVTVTADEFKKTVMAKYNVDFSGAFIGKAEKTSAGMVKYLEVGNTKIKGTEIRTMFKLRSACFDVTVKDENVIFNVTGNGHGVGMSQYGANYLASVGYDYRQILKKYYTGIEFDSIK